MAKSRGVSGFWLDVKSLENHRTHLIAELGAKEGMLAFGAWVRIFTWQYTTASPIKDAQHLARLTNLHIHKARLLWQLLPRLLPRSLYQSPHGLLCQRTMETLRKHEKKQELAGAAYEPQKRRDSDSDSDIGRNVDMEDISTPDFAAKSARNESCPFSAIVGLYHEMLCPPLPKVQKLTKTRMGFIRQRWQEDMPTLDQWRNFFSHVAQSDFLMGRTEPGRNRVKPFLADLEWMTRPGNIAKIAEGKYNNVSKSTQPKRRYVPADIQTAAAGRLCEMQYGPQKLENKDETMAEHDGPRRE